MWFGQWNVIRILGQCLLAMSLHSACYCFMATSFVHYDTKQFTFPLLFFDTCRTMAVRRLRLDNRMSWETLFKCGELRGNERLVKNQTTTRTKKLQEKINQKNDNECFIWCHIRHLTTMHRESRKLTDKALINELDYSDIEFPVSVKQ